MKGVWTAVLQSYRILILLKAATTIGPVLTEFNLITQSTGFIPSSKIQLDYIVLIYFLQRNIMDVSILATNSCRHYLHSQNAIGHGKSQVSETWHKAARTPAWLWWKIYNECLDQRIVPNEKAISNMNAVLSMTQVQVLTRSRHKAFQESQNS